MIDRVKRNTGVVCNMFLPWNQDSHIAISSSIYYNSFVKGVPFVEMTRDIDFVLGTLDDVETCHDQNAVTAREDS
jgi:hypothetical protein